MRATKVIWLLLALATPVSGCKKTSTESGVSEADINAAIRGNTALAIDLCRQLCSSEGNLLFSPYSISTNLALLHAGARGKTEEEVAKMLHFSLAQERFHRVSGELHRRLSKIQEVGQIELSLASSLWPQHSVKFRSDYLSLTEKYYGASITAVDYGNARQACDRINRWVEEKTEHKISNLIAPEMFDEQTCLVLVNAIYFKGSWADQFDPRDTKNHLFYVTPQESVQIPMMFRKGEGRYAQVDGLQVLELPYTGNDLSMVIFLPIAKDGLSRIEEILSADTLLSWKRQLREQQVTMYIPRFMISYGCQLKRTFQTLGMIDAFEKSADFSGMTEGNTGFHVNEVIHQAFIEVNEEGTEAAAATGGSVTFSRKDSPPRPIFRADHPFLFLIQNNSDGNILFLGRVVNPGER